MDDVNLRPIQEDDLDALGRFGLDPEAGGEFEWTGFQDPRPIRKRWEEDGYLGTEHTWLAVALADGTLAGIVTWKDRTLGRGQGLCFELGIALLPEHRGQGVGTVAQRLAVEYLFAHTPAHRIQAFTEVENLAEQRSLEKVGFRREGVMRELFLRAGQWRDSVVYALLRPGAVRSSG